MKPAPLFRTDLRPIRRSALIGMLRFPRTVEASAIGRSGRKYDREFRGGAVRIVGETGKPIAQVARDLVVNEGTWCARERRARKKDRSLDRAERAELERLRAEHAELRMERDVLIGHVEAGPGRLGTTSGDVVADRGSPLETGASRRVWSVFDAVVAEGQSWFEPPAG